MSDGQNYRTRVAERSVGGQSYSLDAFINDSDYLVFEGNDSGPLLEGFPGDDEISYSISIGWEEKNKLLMKLIQQSLSECHDIRSWLAMNGIEYEYHNTPIFGVPYKTDN
ncbi:hypothetical protein [Ruegeria marina]|uniref:Uncharacterized protein n=1 Tax=Ruegeria marina TaxID=639004 RepID=A0A1G7D8T1_9RHOB|nr:hypothetical protein [Ruegeria marina]SDE48048.1 hypothetical protein SAMN04488239_12058 [Ruegeria marina]